VPLREGPAQPAPPPKHGSHSTRPALRGIWTGIAAIALVVLLALLLIMPVNDEDTKLPSEKVEKGSPAPNSIPNQKP
jgi:hypothetical protein